MLIVGAGGLAAQTFDNLTSLYGQDLVFWSEVATKYKFIEENYTIIRNDEAVAAYFQQGSRSFILCVSGIEGRQKMRDKFINLGGEPATFLSPGSTISPHITSIGKGTLVLNKVLIEPQVCIGENCLINVTTVVGHGCTIGDNCEIGAGVYFAGEMVMGEKVYVGTGAMILPKLKIGKQAVIAAGAIVKKNVPDYAVVAGDRATVRFFKKP